MKKTIYVALLVSIISTKVLHSQTGALKVTSGHTVIPLNSNFWIRDYNSVPGDNGMG